MTEAPNLSQATGQGTMDTFANYKPYNKTKGQYNPSTDLNSSLYRANKRPLYAPTNFIGVDTIRPDNLQPTRTYNPSGIKGPYTPTVPILRTMPVQPKFQ